MVIVCAPKSVAKQAGAFSNKTKALEFKADAFYPLTPSWGHEKIQTIQIEIFRQGYS